MEFHISAVHEKDESPNLAPLESDSKDVQPKMKIVSSFTHPPVFLNLNDLRKYVEECF